MNRWILLVALALAAGPARAVDRVPVRAATPRAARADSMVFTPRRDAADSTDTGLSLPVRMHDNEAGGWRHLPFGGALLAPPEVWEARHPHRMRDVDLTVDYNRVDQLRLGGVVQLQRPATVAPRLAAAYGYAFGRHRGLYGVQLEQPLQRTARVVFGVDAQRRTDHGDLQQMDDVENSLLLLFAREDWRDYFEREGQGAYLSWRVPDFSTISLHARRDTWRSLAAQPHVVSWVRETWPLRPNPAIDDGETHALLLRLDRLAHDTPRSRGGVYHWIEGETAGRGLGGDFDYARVLADLRSVVRLSPGSTLSMRTVGGSALRGTLPAQREFVIGGADGLRGHPFASYRGDRVALGQLEVSVGVGSPRRRDSDEGLQLLAFVDSGTAWRHAVSGDLAQQRFAFDGGVGIATASDDLRITVARDLHSAGRDVVVAARLQKPF